MKKKISAFLLAMAVTVSGTGMEKILPVSAAAPEDTLQDISMVEMEDMDVSEGTAENLSDGSILWVNPLYPDAAKEARRGITSPQPQQAVEATGSSTYSSVSSAASYVRRQMVSRKERIEFRYTSSGLTADRLKKLQGEILDKVYAVTSSPQEGDYLRYHLAYIRQSYAYTYSGREAYVTWDVQYVSDAAQEKKMKSRIKSVVKSLGLSGCSEAEKIKKIHDYICKNVVYHNDGTWGCHSAYYALEEGKAVCQGYATLFYALGIQAGLKVRCVSGTSNGQPHLWNIVRMGKSWYNLDATWDDQSGKISYRYYLKSNGDFHSHMRDAEFWSTSFCSKYPMSSSSYTGAVAAPTVKSVKSAGSSKVKLTWSRVDTACGYQIYYASGKNGKYKRLGTVKGGAVTTYTASGLIPGKVYYFKVRAYSNLMKSTYSKYSSARSGKAVPSRVTLSGVSAAKQSLRVKWKTVTDADGYEISITCQNGTKTVKKTVQVRHLAKSTQMKTISGLNSGKTCTVRVRAYAAGTTGKVYGSYSSAVKKTVK